MPLPEAYRSLSRPSSAPDAKAFPLRSFSLNLRRRKLRIVRSAASGRATHSAAPPLPRECSFARMETGVTKLAPDIGSLNYAGSFRISSKLFYPLKVPQLLLNFLLLPCLSFLCSVFNVQIVDASVGSFAPAQAPELISFAASPLPREPSFAQMGTRVTTCTL